jgi:hypothetical protein
VVEIKTWPGAVLESHWMYGVTLTLDVLLTTKSCLERRIRLILDVCELGLNDDKPRRACDGLIHGVSISLALFVFVRIVVASTADQTILGHPPASCALSFRLLSPNKACQEQLTNENLGYVIKS